MRAFPLDRLLEFFTSMELLVGLLWLGLAVLTVTLLILTRTHWGQSRPLRKCIVLSLLAHLLLAGYATTVQIVAAQPQADEPVIRVSFVDSRSQRPPLVQNPAVEENLEEKPWEEFPQQAVPQPEPIDPNRPLPDEPSDPKRPSRPQPANLTGDLSPDNLRLADPQQPEPEQPAATVATGRRSPGKSAEKIEVPAAQRRDVNPPNLPGRTDPERPTTANDAQPFRDRASTAGVPNALIEQPAPLPRLAAPATTPDPAASLSALTDRLSQPARSTPADVDRSTPATDMSHKAAQSSAGGADRQLWPSSLALPGGNHAGGEGDPGLPRRDAHAVALPQTPRNRPGRAERPPPNIYSLRTALDRSRLAERHGATTATEEAVKAALAWLADNQEPDGRWDADRHGAGREMLVASRNRQSAGIRSDTGMTGLALLAFLASGHTHRAGAYRENVRRGLEYLLRVQSADGNLGGGATPFAVMYCHAMAACAVSEAYGMTADERLHRPIRRAIGYTIAAQHSSGGGFRYRPGDRGDTSQCGWQLMALKSADLAGIPIPIETRNGLIRFLRTVSAGSHGGLASYRPNEPISRPMTAEALVCWQFLGMPREHPAGNEAGDYLLRELPGDEKTNLYYWYYATLAMYQLQGVHWRRWNDRLQTTLVDSQRKIGPLAGSWDPDTVWGGYGGRVYSTALATLCLEVYYRFLPLYESVSAAVARGE